MKKWLILILFVVWQNNCFCQNKWDIQKCIDYAIENNIGISRQKIFIEYDRLNHLQSRANLLPSVNANLGNNLNFGNSLNDDQYSYTNETFLNGNMGLNAGMNIFRGLYHHYNIQKTALDIQMSAQELEKLKYNLKLDVLSAYMQILFDESVLDLLVKQKELTDYEVEKIQTLVDAGTKAQGDLLEMKAQQAKDKAAITEAENKLDISHLTLKLILNFPEGQKFEIKKPEMDKELMFLSDSVGTVIESAVLLYPGIQSAKYRLESSEKQLKMAKSYYSPRVSLGYSFSTRYNEISYQQGETYGAQFLNNIYNGLYLSVSIPIFNHLSSWKGVEQARIGVLDAGYRMDLEKQELNEKIRKTSADSKAAWAAYQANLMALEAAELSFLNIQEKFSAGLVTSTEYKTESNFLLKVKTDLLKARFQYIFTQEVLDFYKGDPIEL